MQGFFHFFFLGVLLFGGTPQKLWLQLIADMVARKFNNWKGSLLSKAGWLALVKLVIYGTLLHSFMVYKWSI